MRYLAVDFGERRVGLAVCDDGQTLVSPLRQIDRRNDAQVADEIAAAVADEGAGAVVVGLPLNMADDSEGPQARRVRRFAALLAGRLAVPLHFQNEQLSSFSADERLADRDLSSGGQRRRRDAIAAAVILEDFLRERSRDAEQS
ncbi:MAG: putative pre-16S rRNA nuclease [Phycisphaerae bacterium]|nr:putative pre-16S rRNA nuclease [Phycisphaerae bacterium]